MTADPQRCMATVADALANSQRVLLASHTRPDGDAVGSLVGLHVLLQARGVANLPFMREMPSDTYRRVLAADAIRTALPPDETFDTLCILDCGNPDRIDMPESAPPASAFAKVVVIDHHPDNRRYGDVNLVVPEATSTSEILLALAESANWTLPATAATALCLGLLTDCGTFRFNNVSARTFDAAARLMRLGADYRGLVDTLHFREPHGAMRLRHDIFQRTRFTCHGRLAWSYLEPDDLQRHGLHPQDAENVIDVIRCLESVDIACLLQPEPGCIRFSLRSRGPGAGAIARALGGGGHEAAAGARVPNMTLEQAAEALHKLATDEFAKA